MIRSKLLIHRRYTANFLICYENDTHQHEISEFAYIYHCWNVNKIVVLAIIRIESPYFLQIQERSLDEQMREQSYDVCEDADAKPVDQKPKLSPVIMHML